MTVPFPALITDVELKIASVPTRKEFNQKKEWLENYAESQGEPTEDGKMKTKVKISSQPQSTRATVAASALMHGRSRENVRTKAATGR